MGFDRIELGDGAYIDYDPSWLPPSEADLMVRALIAHHTWEQRAIKLFGKDVLQPRLIAWAGALPYRYSGQVLEPRPFVEPLLPLIRRVSELAGAELNHVLLNRYRDGNDSMGMHSDDESELGRDPVVAAISLGAVRRFVLVHRKRKSERVGFELTHGSLLIMGGSIQHHFHHGVPKQKSVTGERLNVTFRRLLRPPE